MDYIKNEIIRYAKLCNNIYMPLSSGYDSNFILHTVNDMKDKKIHAFSIGGIIGTNEVPIVGENLIHFDGVTHHNTIIDENILNFYPDIVWRLEGLLYERGIFLQYALAQLARSVNVDYLICGEGADQQLHQYYLEDMNRALNHKYNANCIFRGNETPFLFGSYVILKKSFILLSSYGITACYPFMAKKISELAYPMRKENGIHKKAYKDFCKNIFYKDIISNINKIGGSTDVEAILTPKSLKKIKTIMENSDLIKKIENIPYHVDIKLFNEYVHKKYLNEYEPDFICLSKAVCSLLHRAILNKLYGFIPNSEDIAKNSVDLELKELCLIIFEKLSKSGVIPLALAMGI